MPIGKNAIKRVENNGYSNVKTDAPDMENSTVIGAPAEKVMEMVEDMAAKSAKKPTKTAAKKTTASKTKKKAPVKTSVERVELGEDLPYYML